MLKIIVIFRVMDYFRCLETVECYTSKGSFSFTAFECYEAYREGTLMVVNNAGVLLRMTYEEYVTHFSENETVFKKITKETYDKYLITKRFDL
jgi:hypothetical protein